MTQNTVNPVLLLYSISIRKFLFSWRRSGGGGGSGYWFWPRKKRSRNRKEVEGTTMNLIQLKLGCG